MIDALIRFFFQYSVFNCILSAIETLFVIEKLSLMGSTFFGTAQTMIHNFQNTLLNSYWQCFRQMPQSDGEIEFNPFPNDKF